MCHLCWAPGLDKPTLHGLAHGWWRWLQVLKHRCRLPPGGCRSPLRMAFALRGMAGDEWMVRHFSQSNPTGEGQGDVARLLRRVADMLDELGDVDVQDVVFHSEVTSSEDDLTMTVYYHQQRRRR